MSRFAERARGVTVKVLDLSDLEAEALEWQKERNPDCTKVNIYGGDWAVAEKDGHLFAICTEGVGFEVTEEEPLTLEFHGNYVARDEETGEIKPNVTKFDVMPFGSYDLIPQDLLDYPVAEEKDLADYVRTFGARLEDNFWLWFKELS